MARSEQHIAIQAPVDTVWSILTNPYGWAPWFPATDQITRFDPATGNVELQHRGALGHASIRYADKPQGVMVVNLAVDGQQTAHTFAIDRAGSLFDLHDGVTTLSYMLEYDSSGGFFRHDVAPDTAADARTMRQVLEQVKARAEGSVPHETPLVQQPLPTLPQQDS